MHTTGKVFLFINLVLAAGAVYFTAKFVQVRNAWLAQVEAAEESVEKTAEQLAEAEVTNETLESELARHRYGWGRFWDNVDTSVEDSTVGRINISLGRAQGLNPVGEQQKLPEVYGFYPDAESGGLVYAGRFQVLTLEAQAAALQLQPAPLPGQTANWPSGGNWRFRETLPAGLRVRFPDLQTALTIQQAELDKRQQIIEQEKINYSMAERDLQNRVNQLQGDNQADASVNADLANGLVKAIQMETEARNAELEKLQAFRNKLDGLYKQIASLLKENADLAKQLDDATAPEKIAKEAGRDISG